MVETKEIVQLQYRGSPVRLKTNQAIFRPIKNECGFDIEGHSGFPLAELLGPDSVIKDYQEKPVNVTYLPYLTTIEQRQPITDIMNRCCFGENGGMGRKHFYSKLKKAMGGISLTILEPKDLNRAISEANKIFDEYAKQALYSPHRRYAKGRI